MAMQKNDTEQVNAKSGKDEAEDIFDDDDAESDDVVEDIDIKEAPNKDLAARKRLEEYLEEKRLRKELGDDFSDY